MRNASKSVTPAVAALALIVGGAAHADAATVYNGGTNGTTIYTFNGSSTGNIGYGDDYNTGLTGNFQLTGLTFTGGLQGTGSHLFIDFYNASGQMVTTFTPDDADVTGYGTHTLGASLFGSGGVAVPASGYLIFSPFRYDTATPAFSIFAGSTPTVGSSSSTLAAMTSPNSGGTGRVLSTGAYFPAGFGPTNQVAVFSLTSPTPEPASLGLIGAGAAGLLRRRRVTKA